MSERAIAMQVSAVLSTALPAALVQVGSPVAVHDALVAYIITTEPAPDILKATRIVMIRHQYMICVLLAMAGDEQLAEYAMMDISDSLRDAFYGNRLLNGSANTSQLVPLGGPLYVEYQSGTYRSRRWRLDVDEDKAYVFA